MYIPASCMNDATSYEVRQIWAGVATTRYFSVSTSTCDKTPAASSLPDRPIPPPFATAGVSDKKVNQTRLEAARRSLLPSDRVRPGVGLGGEAATFKQSDGQTAPEKEFEVLQVCRTVLQIRASSSRGLFLSSAFAFNCVPPKDLLYPYTPK